MPFWSVYNRLGLKHAEAYNLLTLAAGAIACMLISIFISVAMFRASERERDMQAEVNRKATCEVIGAQVTAFREQAPITQAGKNAANAWEALAVRFHCKEAPK